MKLYSIHDDFYDNILWTIEELKISNLKLEFENNVAIQISVISLCCKTSNIYRKLSPFPLE